MTDLAEFLASAKSGQRLEVDWTTAPWAPAHRALRWLGFAPEIGEVRPSAVLSSADVDLLCREMVTRFTNPDGQLAWSSHLLDRAFDAIEVALDAPPEPLLRAVWDSLADRPLDRLVYNLARAVGVEVFAKRRHDSRWDLSWMLRTRRPSQVCLRYFTIGVRLDRWNEELERETQEVLAAHGLSDPDRG
jgi:hypothetical protein